MAAVAGNYKRRPRLVTGRRSHEDLQNGSDNIRRWRDVFNDVESAALRFTEGSDARRR